MYCLASPAHGPPTGFLGHRNRRIMGVKMNGSRRREGLLSVGDLCRVLIYKFNTDSS